MSLDLRMLRIFLAVCETGSISRAAQRAHLSQPALTRRMQDLEGFCGTPLLRRTPKGVELTEAGRLFELRAKEMLALAERTQRELDKGAGRFGGIVRIGLVESKVTPLAAELLEAWTTLHPQARFEVYAADGDALRAKLDADQLDLAFLIEPVETAKYESVALPIEERWGVVMRMDAPLAQAESLSPQDLTQMPLIAPGRHLVRETLASSFSVEAEALRIVGTHNLLTDALELVRRGIGSALTIEGAYALRPSPDLIFVPIVPELHAGHQLVRRLNRPLSFSAENFWQLCLEKLKKQAS